MVGLWFVFNGILALLLAATGGLLIVVHFRLKKMQSALQHSPAFSDELTNNMVRAKATLAQLATAIEERGPDLERDVRKADNALQDLDFVLARADKVLNRLEERMQQASDQTGTNLAAPDTNPFASEIERSLQQAQQPNMSQQDIMHLLQQQFLRQPTEPQPELQPTQPVHQPAPSNVVSPAVLAHRRLASAYQEGGKRKSTVSEDELRKALEDRL